MRKTARDIEARALDLCRAGLTQRRVAADLGVSQAVNAPAQREPLEHVPCPCCDGAGVVVCVNGVSLRRMRLRAKLSLRELARRCGISPPYLSDIELGRRQPSARVRDALCRGVRR